MLLVRAGLSEGESDRFLERLGDDLHAGKLEDQDARLKFIEAELAQIQDWQHAQPKPPSDVRIAVVAVITGLFTNALYHIVKGPAIRVADDLFAAQARAQGQRMRRNHPLRVGCVQLLLNPTILACWAATFLTTSVSKAVILQSANCAQSDPPRCRPQGV